MFQQKATSTSQQDNKSTCQQKREKKFKWLTKIRVHVFEIKKFQEKHLVQLTPESKG